MNKMCFFFVFCKYKTTLLGQNFKDFNKRCAFKGKNKPICATCAGALECRDVGPEKNDEHNSTFLFCSLATWGVNGYFSKADFAF